MSSGQGESPLGCSWGSSLSTDDGPAPLAYDRREAARYLRGGTPAELDAFARRQLRARHRLTHLLAFYRAHPCRMPRTHLLAACAITLGRFCGYSRTFDAIGEALTPI